MKSKRICPCEVGDIIVKNNYKPFGHDNISLKVEFINFNNNRWVVNKIYLVSNGQISKITEEENDVLVAEWESIGISEFNGSESDPCIRTDTGLPKESVPESHVKELVYSSVLL